MAPILKFMTFLNKLTIYFCKKRNKHIIKNIIIRVDFLFLYNSIRSKIKNRGHISIKTEIQKNEKFPFFFKSKFQSEIFGEFPISKNSPSPAVLQEILKISLLL